MNPQHKYNHANCTQRVDKIWNSCSWYHRPRTLLWVEVNHSIFKIGRGVSWRTTFFHCNTRTGKTASLSHIPSPRNATVRWNPKKSDTFLGPKSRSGGILGGPPADRFDWNLRHLLPWRWRAALRGSSSCELHALTFGMEFADSAHYREVYTDHPVWHWLIDIANCVHPRYFNHLYIRRGQLSVGLGERERERERDFRSIIGAF